jgi:hypothetical protein
MYGTGYHCVDGIAATAADPNYFNNGALFNGLIKFKHASPPLYSLA